MLVYAINLNVVNFFILSVFSDFKFLYINVLYKFIMNEYFLFFFIKNNRNY